MIPNLDLSELPLESDVHETQAGVVAALKTLIAFARQ
jgi:hypothetical protein